MTESQPRTKQLTIKAVEALRAHDPLAERLYLDTVVPSDPSERLRIHEGDPARKDAPAQIAVSVVASGSTHRGGQQTKTYVLDCTFEASKQYYEGITGLGFADLRDRADAVFDSPIGDSIYPDGPAGEGDPHEVGESGRRSMTARWRVVVHWSTDPTLAE